MALHYYDPGDGSWKSIAEPTEADIAEVLIAAATDRPCAHCDADCEYSWASNGVPNIVVEHQSGCPDAA